ncbi:hypothetical protein [Candidatus Avelusimicrobium sp.]|uniref:hypothetical protein n=1 Tax=Candidatus Avelusimicrobium sp. TaxID=3048833 RepID=UPI003D7EA2EE
MQKRILFLSCLAVLLAQPSFAQSALVKGGAKATGKNFIKKVVTRIYPRVRVPQVPSVAVNVPITPMAPSVAVQVSQQIAAASRVQSSLLKGTALQPFEQNTPHFLFTVSAAGKDGGFKASGFVIAEEYNGETVLWGIAPQEYVQYMGKDVEISFYIKDKKFTYPAEVVLAGRAEGINAALIRLPQEALQVARPVMWAKDYPKKGTNLFTYGYNKGQYQKAQRRVLTANTERIIEGLNPEAEETLTDAGGLVVTDKGEAVGLSLGTSHPLADRAEWYWNRYSNRNYPKKQDLSNISEIVPFSRLQDLLREYRNPGSARRVLLFGGLRVGKLPITETVKSVTAYYEDGFEQTLNQNPLLEVTSLDTGFEFKGLQKAKIIISRADGSTYAYWVDMQTRNITLEEAIK